MESGKMGRYLKYAVGEIVLVMIGILLALQINNWNESRKQSIAEVEFLKGIKSDLIQDKAYMASVLEKVNSKIEAYKELDSSNSKADIEFSLESYMFIGNYTFYPISGAFQSAISGNEINTFKRKETISILVKLYNSTYPRLIDNASQLDSRWESLSEKYRHDRRIGYFEKLTSERLSEIKDDIYFHYIQIEWYKSVLQSAQTEINEILEKIDD